MDEMSTMGNANRREVIFFDYPMVGKELDFYTEDQVGEQG